MGRERAGRVASCEIDADLGDTNISEVRTPLTLLVRIVDRIPLKEGIEPKELESKSPRGGVAWGIEVELDVEDESDEGNLGREREEVIGDREGVDEVLRGIRGKGAPALLAVWVKQSWGWAILCGWRVMVEIIQKTENKR